MGALNPAPSQPSSVAALDTGGTGPFSVLVKVQERCALNPFLIPRLASPQHRALYSSMGKNPPKAPEG